MAIELERHTTTIKKGRLDANPVYTGGKAVRFIALPVDPSGKVSLASSTISFKGCFGNDAFFNVLDTAGRILKVSTRTDLGVPHIPNYLDAAPVLLPMQNPDLFAGIQMVVPVLERTEAEDKEIILYLG